MELTTPNYPKWIKAKMTKENICECGHEKKYHKNVCCYAWNTNHGPAVCPCKKFEAKEKTYNEVAHDVLEGELNKRAKPQNHSQQKTDSYREYADTLSDKIRGMGKGYRDNLLVQDVKEFIKRVEAIMMNKEKSRREKIDRLHKIAGGKLT